MPDKIATLIRRLRTTDFTGNSLRQIQEDADAVCREAAVALERLSARAAKLEALTAERPIIYKYDGKGNILLPKGPPFDGSEVLIKLNLGWVQARWEPGETVYNFEGVPDTQGFCWVCLDDSYPQQELDAALAWQPLPQDIRR